MYLFRTWLSEFKRANFPAMTCSAADQLASLPTMNENFVILRLRWCPVSGWDEEIYARSLALQRPDLLRQEWSYSNGAIVRFSPYPSRFSQQRYLFVDCVEIVCLPFESAMFEQYSCDVSTCSVFNFIRVPRWVSFFTHRTAACKYVSRQWDRTQH